MNNLPEIIARCERRWSIRAGEPLERLSYNFIAPAIRKDGVAVVLKIGYPNKDLTTEIEALLAFDGRSCVRLLDVDRGLGSLLLERLEPGKSLLIINDDEAATRIAAGVMRDLWRPVPEEDVFPTVRKWARGMERLRSYYDGGTGPLSSRLVEKAEALFSELIDSMETLVLLHGDLHHENILCSQKRQWLAIDPKGVLGEPAYETGVLLRNPFPQLLEQPDPGRVISRRVDILCEELGFERERVLGWGLAQAVLSAWWSIEDHGDGWQWAMRCAEQIDKILVDVNSIL
ncbi:MAG: aminoglycoside phosphotransferase family protein [Chloroflexota bacterium]|nr:aminoglycoside phosphotransferase family protein [Chloroflexota bacterium]